MSRAPRRSPMPTCESGADRRAYKAAVAVTACKFQDDPHNQKITHSTFEEYGANSTHLRDRLLLASRAAPGRLAEDAGRARLLRALHAGVDELVTWGASNGPPKPPGARRARRARGAPRFSGRLAGLCHAHASDSNSPTS